MDNTNLSTFSPNYPSLIRIFLVGVLIVETFIASKLLGERLEVLSNSNGITFLSLSAKEWLWLTVISYLLMTVYLVFSKNFLTTILIVTRSIRVDLLLLIIAGGFFTLAFDGFFINFLRSKLIKLEWIQMQVVALVPIVTFVASRIRHIQINRSIKKIDESHFIGDEEIKCKDEDKFQLNEKAEVFAEKVFDSGSTRSLVFGIDAPWGVGKSSFINLCIEYWKEQHKNKIIVYSFSPLRYENQDDLLGKFIDGLIKTIKLHTYIPEMDSIISKYAKLLNNTKASFFGISASLPFEDDNIEIVFSRLESTLLGVNKKIVVVIDDLDRLQFSSIKEVLFVIKKAFTLPNVSYVICYDTENITALEDKKLSSEKIGEFLEKFINVKMSLYLDSKLLLRYFLETNRESLQNNLLADPKLVSIAVEGLIDIFESSDFHNYQAFVGDVRKLKRLVNTILLLEIEKTDFNNSDFNKEDLIRLLIIYVNYPNIFRKIHSTETNKRRGFFSVVFKNEDEFQADQDDNNYSNSKKYTEYVKSLTEQQKFILDEVFCVHSRLGDSLSNGISDVSNEVNTSYACFNGGWMRTGGRNLEAYLSLITDMSVPVKTEQYKFYVNTKNRFLSEKPIRELFSEEEFYFSSGEKTHEQLWRVLVNTNAEEFSVEKSTEIINYSLDVLPTYSLLEIENIGLGFRKTLIYFIIKLLDQIGWTDEKNKHSHNNIADNIIKISGWIFGDKNHERSIIDILGDKNRGVLGFQDLLTFRLSCCANRGGNIYNLQRSMSLFGNPNAPTSGDTRKIAVEQMREISQRIYFIFETIYIDKKENIFDEIDDLSLEDVCGNYTDYVKSHVELGEVNVHLLTQKSTLKGFIIYQIGSKSLDSGIGCGYYRTKGKEDNGKYSSINLEITKYLIDICFNPEISENNYKHFLDYLLINLSRNFNWTSSESKYEPNINELTRVISKDKLTNYWKEHGETIKSKGYEREDKKVYTPNYIALYRDDLSCIYEVLDDLLKVDLPKEE